MCVRVCVLVIAFYFFLKQCCTGWAQIHDPPASTSWDHRPCTVLETISKGSSYIYFSLFFIIQYI
jgi:hypothetical protein